MRAMTKDVAELLLESFRVQPANGAAAARHAGCNQKTGLKAWRKGLNVVGYPMYLRPFSELIAAEQLEARARMEEEQVNASQLATKAEALRQQQVREKAIKDITDTRTQEGALVRAARTTTGQALGALAHTGAGVAKVSQLVRQALEQLVVKGDVGVVCVVTDPIAYQRELQAGREGLQHLQAMSLIEAKGYSKTLATFATALRQVNDAAQKALEMERLILGEPTSIVGHKHLEGMTMAEADEHIKAAARAMKMLKEKGIKLSGDVGAEDAVVGDGGEKIH